MCRDGSSLQLTLIYLIITRGVGVGFIINCIIKRMFKHCRSIIPTISIKRLITFHHHGYICSICCKYFHVFSSFMTYHWVCSQNKSKGFTIGAGTAYPYGPPQFTLGFQWGSCHSIFCVMFSRQLFVLLSFFFCPLFCLSFFDLHILITQ